MNQQAFRYSMGDYMKNTDGREEGCWEFFIKLGMLSVVSESDAESASASDGSLFSINIHADEDHHRHRRVHVAVGKTVSSMDALQWALNHALAPSSSTVLHLIHVFPVIHLVPSPFGGGMLPKSQANPTVVDSYSAQQRHKTDNLLQTYIHACSPFKVRVETVAVESDVPGKAILDLIPCLNITRLIIGSTKSTLRRVKSKRGTAAQILENAPQTCEVSVICKGKQVMDGGDREAEMGRSPSGSSAGTAASPHAWKLFRWKSSRTPDQLPLSSFYHNLLK